MAVMDLWPVTKTPWETAWQEAWRGATATADPDTNLTAFVQRHNPTLLDYEHVPRLLSVAERVASGLLKRVIVLLPPRYFKTETFSRLLPPYYLRQNPTHNVGLASYGAELAWSISEEAKLTFQADGGTLRADTHAKKRWKTDQGGEMWAAGVGGPMLGFGFHLGIIDDPTDPEKAHSPTYQRRFQEWYPSKFLSRQEPDAAILVVMQRLGVADPIDFLFRREVGEDTDLAPEHWHVVVCDEIKSGERLGRWDGPMGLPPTCTIEEDPRGEGEPLAPSRFTLAQAEALQTAAGAYVARAQRQQRPAALQGDFWKAEWFGWEDGTLVDHSQVYDELPANAYNGGKDWDTAYTKDERNSASGYVESYRGPGKPDEFPIYIHDVDWDWLEYPELVAWIKALKGPHYIEEKATGKSAAQSLRRENVSVTEVPVDGDKLSRSAAVQPIVSNRRVFVRRAVLRKLLEGERQGLLRVTAEALATGGSDLDVNDMFTQALHRHAGKKPHVRSGYSGMVHANPR